MRVNVGDIIQVDGGLVIVSEVEKVLAHCLPLPGFKNPKADVLKHGFSVEQTSRNIIERRGEAGLQAFRDEQGKAKSAAKNSMVTLELGDALCYHGERCTVIAVVEDGALLEDSDGNEYEEQRQVNEFLFADCSCKGHVAGRLDEEGRAENLKQHLAARAAASQAAAANGPAAETVNNNTETKKEPVMKANNKQNSRAGRHARRAESKPAKSVKAEKQPKAEKPKRAANKNKQTNGSGHMEKIFGFSVCAVLRRLGKEGVKFEQAVQILAAKKISMPEQSLKVQLSLFKQRTPADLTGDQVKELKALA